MSTHYKCLFLCDYMDNLMNLFNLLEKIQIKSSVFLNAFGLSDAKQLIKLILPTVLRKMLTFYTLFTFLR